MSRQKIPSITSDTPYREFDKFALAAEYESLGKPPKDKLEKEYRLLFKAMRKAGLIAIMNKNSGEMPLNIMEILEEKSHSRKEKRLWQDRIGDLSESNREREKRRAYANSTYSDLKERMERIKEEGILPPENSSFCRETIKKGVIEKSAYKQNRICGEDVPEIAEILKKMGITNERETKAGKRVTQAIVDSFNYPYPLVIHEKSEASNKEMCIMFVKDYLECVTGETLIEAYAGMKNLEVREAKRVLVDSMLSACMKGFRYLKERLDETKDHLFFIETSLTPVLMSDYKMISKPERESFIKG